MRFTSRFGFHGSSSLSLDFPDVDLGAECGRQALTSEGFVFPVAMLLEVDSASTPIIHIHMGSSKPSLSAASQRLAWDFGGLNQPVREDFPWVQAFCILLNT